MPSPRRVVLAAVLILTTFWVTSSGAVGPESAVSSARAASSEDWVGGAGDGTVLAPVPSPASGIGRPAATTEDSGPSELPSGTGERSDCGDRSADAAVGDGRMDAFASRASVTAKPGSRSGRLIFAHYMPNFPVSIDNRPADEDYYAQQYLNPAGENGKHAAYGGFIRDRPLPRPVSSSPDWLEQDLGREIRQASACDIDGFSVDIMQTEGPQHWGQLLGMLKVAAATAPDFRIMLMPDMSVLPDGGPDQLAQKLAPLASYSSAFRLPYGRLVISPFLAEARSPAWWQQFRDAMASRGVPVALVMTFLDVSRWESYASVSYGISNWGYRNPQANSLAMSAPLAPGRLPAAVHARGKIWMQPVSVQDSRPRLGTFEEAANTGTLRASWAVAIDARADWVQLATWNDYGENTQFAPSVRHGWTFLQISRYYAAWWRAGRPPRVEGDQMFLTYRTQPWTARSTSSESSPMRWTGVGTRPRNTVEVLTILSRPAVASLSVGNEWYRCSAPAGVHVCTAPLTTGAVSAELERGDRRLAVSGSGPAVTNSPRVQDLQYVAITGRTS